MKHIPDLMLQKIKRESDYEYVAPDHPSVGRNEKIQQQMASEELRIYSAAKALKGSNQESWAVFEGALLEMYRLAKQYQNSGFFELVAQRADPAFFTYTKIYAQAKIEVLEAILSVSQIPVESLEKISPHPIEKKSNKIVDFFRKFVRS